MAWTLTEPVSGLTVPLTPNAGDITVTEDRTTVVIYPGGGGSPFVAHSGRRPATPTVPELVFERTVDFEMLRAIWGTGRRLLLVDDGGVTWPVQIVGGIKARVIDTPIRPTKPLRYVTLTLVGVV